MYEMDHRPAASTLAQRVFRKSAPGIDPKKLAGIFGAFITTKTHGTGLGLAICHMIVERHGGQLTALSDGKSGALFRFILPIEGIEDLNSHWM